MAVQETPPVQLLSAPTAVSGSPSLQSSSHPAVSTSQLNMETEVGLNYALGLFLFVCLTTILSIPLLPPSHLLTNLSRAGFIFTFLLWILTLRSTVVFCLLFFWLWLAFLMLALAYILTPKYHRWSAEQRVAGSRWDVWALGCVLRVVCCAGWYCG